MIGLLNFDRVVGAIVGGMIAWCVLAALNQFIWLPAELERGRNLERAAALKKSMELIEQRSRTNAEIRNLDTDGLCVALGGSYVDGVCQ